MNCYIPDYIHFSSEEDIDEQSLKSYETSDDEEYSIFYELKDIFHNFFHITHILTPGDNHDNHIKHYVAFASLLGYFDKNNNKVKWIWNEPKLFSYSKNKLEFIKEKFKNYISNINYDNSLYIKSYYDTEIIINDFYKKINETTNDIEIDSLNIKKCLKISNNNHFIDKVHMNCIFKSLNIK